MVWQTGTGPFVTGFSTLDARTLVLGAGIAVLTTFACAWRWHLVAGGLGVGIRMPPAVASCYRGQFLNLVLPGGVLGDVHRGVAHGRDAGDTGRALRAVAWERVAGQVVTVALAVVVLLLLSSPVTPLMPAAVRSTGRGCLWSACWWPGGRGDRAARWSVECWVRFATTCGSAFSYDEPGRASYSPPRQRWPAMSRRTSSPPVQSA